MISIFAQIEGFQLREISIFAQISDIVIETEEFVTSASRERGVG